MAVKTFKVFYDGACPICSREVSWLGRRLRQSAAVEFIDISSPGFAAASYGLSQPELEARLHAQTPAGQIITGMAVVRALYQAAGWGWLTAPTAWPFLRPICDWLYQRFAANRRRLSRLLLP